MQSSIIENCHDIGPAVVLRKCSVRFRNSRHQEQMVLDNLDMTVNTGSIYGLLGPSGAGKTTLLKCILGMLKVQSGSVMVLGCLPGMKGNTGSNIGYMPQELALYSALTMAETLRFYGQLAGHMTSDEIESKINFFIDHLRLPKKETLNSKLSGGQLRRVSFVAAVLHEPKLIVIDEPTVGMDPIVKQRIWDYLLDITRNQLSTVILTTHYVEEANMAERVGMLQWGRLQIEDNPKAILQRYQCNTLEEGFLKLCAERRPKCSNGEWSETIRSESKGIDDGTPTGSSANVWSYKSARNRDNKDYRITCHASCNRCAIQVSKPNYARLRAAVWKNFILIYRFPGIILLSVLLPIVQVTMFMLVFNGQFDDTRISIVNGDAGYLGQKYLDLVSTRSIKQVNFDTYDSGYHAVLNGDTNALVVIGGNFSQYIQNRASKGIFAESNSNSSIEDNIISVFMESTNYHISELVKMELMSTFMKFSQSINNSTTNDNHIDMMLIEFRSSEISWTNRPHSIFLSPGFCVNVIHFCPFVVSIMLLFMDKQLGYMERNKIAGMTLLEAILAVLVNECVGIFVQVVCIMVALCSIIDIPVIGSYFAIFCILYTEGVAGTALGILIAVTTSDCLTMANLTMLMLFLAMPFSGLFWPIESTHTVFAVICHLSPYYYPGVALKGIAFKGWTMSHPDVLLGLIVPLTWSIILLIATIPASKLLSKR